MALCGVQVSQQVEWIPWDGKGGRITRGVHAFTKQILKWDYCSRCGLILLRNPASKQAERSACQMVE